MSIAGCKHLRNGLNLCRTYLHGHAETFFSEQKYVWSYYWNDTSAEILRHFTNSTWLNAARGATMLVTFCSYKWSFLVFCNRLSGAIFFFLLLSKIIPHFKEFFKISAINKWQDPNLSTRWDVCFLVGIKNYSPPYYESESF